MDVDKIKHVLGSKNYDVNVITSRDGERINGQVATWVTQVSVEPTLMIVCLAPTRYTSELIDKSGRLTINILSKDQVDLVPHFGYQSGRDVDKFAAVPYKKGVTGCPIVEGVAGYLECKVRNTYPGGDHLIHVVEVVDGQWFAEKEPLSYQWLLSRTQAA